MKIAYLFVWYQCLPFNNNKSLSLVMHILHDASQYKMMQTRFYWMSCKISNGNGLASLRCRLKKKNSVTSIHL